jgi:hypothetical protein
MNRRLLSCIFAWCVRHYRTWHQVPVVSVKVDPASLQHLPHHSPAPILTRRVLTLCLGRLQISYALIISSDITAKYCISLCMARPGAVSCFQRQTKKLQVLCLLGENDEPSPSTVKCSSHLQYVATPTRNSSQGSHARNASTDVKRQRC